MSTSNIEWTQRTWNPVTGCTRVSKGCDNCYAVTMTHRLERMGQVEKYGGLTVLNGKGDRHFSGVVKCHENALEIPLKRRIPTTYFVNSMSDLFHPNVPFMFIAKVFGAMQSCPQHTFQVLTKRPEMAVTFYDWFLNEWLLKGDYERNYGHVWLGTSCENQETADERIPHLLKCPAAVRFLSLEPLLGPIELPIRRISQIQRDEMVGYSKASRIAGAERIHWIIAGGESGPGARPSQVEWYRSIRDQCRFTGSAFFMKQTGKHLIMEVEEKCPDGRPKRWAELKVTKKGGDMSEWPEDLRIREMPQLERQTA